MSENVPYTKAMTTAELSDHFLYAAYKMPTGEMALKRAAQLCSASSLPASDLPYACYGNKPCGKGSCPPCRTRQNRISIINTLSMVNDTGGPRAWQAISITPEIGKVDVGELPMGGLRGFGNKISAAVRKIIPDAVAVMCVSIAWERKSGEQEYWQYGAKGIISTQDPKALEQLRARFAWKKKLIENDGWVLPVAINPIGDIIDCLAEMSKPQFIMRDQRPDADGKLKSEAGSVTIEQELQLAKVLSKSKVTQRFFYIGK